MTEEYETPEEFVEEDRECLERVIRHSSDPSARAWAWAILDAGSDGPELDDLERELETLRRQREEGSA